MRAIKTGVEEWGVGWVMRARGVGLPSLLTGVPILRREVSSPRLSIGVTAKVDVFVKILFVIYNFLRICDSFGLGTWAKHKKRKTP
jgi:hypothetical protein